MPDAPLDPEADPSRAFLDALHRFVEFAELCLAMEGQVPVPPHFPLGPFSHLFTDALSVPGTK
jgi:hypothetical protein